MHVARYYDVEQYRRVFRSAWQENEAENGVFLRMLGTARADPPICLAVQNVHSQTLATACVFQGDQIVLSQTTGDAIDTLVQYLVAEDIVFPGIFAPRPTSTHLAARIHVLRGHRFQVVKTLAHWELETLPPVCLSSGRARKADGSDRDRLIEWKNALQRESNTRRPVDPTSSINRDLAAGRLWVWDLKPGTPVAMGAIYREHASCSGLIDGVYTESEHRLQGIAASLVLYLCQVILAEREVVVLSSDAAHEPASRLYKSTGFTVRCHMDNMRQV